MKKRVVYRHGTANVVLEQGVGESSN